MGTSFGRGGATTFQQDLQNADCIVIQGSNMAECHPVGFQWVMEAKQRGAAVFHVDPRFTRTSALADAHVPLRAGTDIAFLGGLVNYVLQNELDFRDYVLEYTNAAAIVDERFRDTEDLDGLFSGYDPETGSYDPVSWAYADATAAAAAGHRDMPKDGHAGSASLAASPERAGAGGPAVSAKPHQDRTLQDSRCVYQILKRHYARYTPEMVERVCGIPQEMFRKVAEAVTSSSGRDRTTAWVYSVGWTQHTVGVQYIRTAAILQLLLGNVGRPGGGILALRGHASIQGSTDIPTLFNLLPGYIPMPHAHHDENLDSFVEDDAGATGFWGNMKAYAVSLLKAWWGDAATEDNDFCFGYLPRLSGDHGTYRTVLDQIAGDVKGYFVIGENPAVGSANSRLQRLGLANLEWLVVRDLQMIETATFWNNAPELETGELVTEQIPTEVFFLPAASHTEKDGTFTNTQRLLQWHHKAVEPQGDQRSDLWFYYHLGRRIREKLAGSTDPRDRPVLDLTWEYPTEGEVGEPSAEAVLREINGVGPDSSALSAFTELADDGSTACGCWIYCGCFTDEVNQPARRKPGSEQSWVAPEWAWSWPANRRILYNRASADADGRPWSARKAYVWWDATEERWTGHDVPDFEVTKPPDYEPEPNARAQDALSGTDAFVMQTDGKAWLYVPTGLLDGPLPTHYEPQESPFTNLIYGQQVNPVRHVYRHPANRYHPMPTERGVDVFPYVFTTYRLTEHHTAGGMSRFLPYLSELQPAFFCEVSPELAAQRGLEHGGWATIITARTAVEARVLVTDRMRAVQVQDRTVHQVGIPYHWGPNGLSTGDAGNELLSAALDPNVHIQESKAATCDVLPGRRPRGPDLEELVRDYRARAGITEDTGITTGRVGTEGTASE
ncbi:formate dehydrogenase [Actinobacteria bacterium YIM 96077]|uniref:Formate dehydrogenase n=1 Tax=Phytoactinopolyspora halophila TaxID=1981511 RepID=A0A329QRX1_9ACTN|nr:formate dehydrogenase [Actinobacteria bacterium YIM 96077]RAW14761.1 formate dehydrogenase [Phytoactinopolyspora halophila]